jgi:hypothetical protein
LSPLLSLLPWFPKRSPLHNNSGSGGRLSKRARAHARVGLRLEPLEPRWLPTGDFTNINAMLQGLDHSAAAWGDYNSDGHLDLVITGFENNSTRFTQVYAGNGAGGFTLDTNANITPPGLGSVAWGDYNNDGHLDIVVTGLRDGGQDIAEVYRGDGAGGFTLVANTSITGVESGAVAWGDYNNDGHLDLVINGDASSGGRITQVYAGDGAGNFRLESKANLTAVGLQSSVAWGDFNNDGNLDLTVCGSDLNGTFIEDIYRGDGTGGFTREANPIPSGEYARTMNWGDYNSDGHLDLLVGGGSTNGSRFIRVYQGDGNGGFTLDANANFGGISVFRSAWGDFNNDGHLDFVYGGRRASDGAIVSQVYTGDGAGGFSLDVNANLTAYYQGMAAWGDFDNDNRLDLLICGNDANDTSITQVYQNTSGAPANSAPTAPGNLSTTFPSSTVATFSWNAATDGQTTSAGLSYALRVGTTPGGADIVNPMSNLVTGQRTISSFGLIQGTSYTLTGLTPNKAYFWSVQAIDGGLQGGAFATEQSFTQSGQGNQAPTITSVNKTTFAVATIGSFTVTATGAPTPTLAESGALPSGVSFNAATGKLSGTPATGTSGIYALIFTASNGVGNNATQSFTLTVDQGNQAPIITSADKTAFAVSAAGSFTVTATGTPTPTLVESGALPNGVTFNADTGLLSGTPGPGTSGSYTVTFTASNGVGTDAVQTFTLTIKQSPTFTSANKASFAVGAAGSFTVTTTGFPTPVLSEAGALPSGVTFNAATGLLSGTPAPGTNKTYVIIFTASNGVGSNATQIFTLTVDQASQAPAITSANKTTFIAGSAGSFQVTATGFPSPTLSALGAMPSGVSFHTDTGLLSGTPAPGTGGSYVLSFTASNGVGSNAVQSFTLFVNQSPSFTSASKTTFAVGQAGSFQIMASGFPAPVLGATGSLPSGVTFDAGNGLLSGTPAPGTGGTYALTFTAGNGIGASASQSFILTINQSPAFTSGSSTTFTAGSFGSFAVTASGTPAPLLATRGALPNGVTFNVGSGLLSGTPAAGTGGSYPFTFTATNGIGEVVAQNFILTVNQAPEFTSAAVASFTEGSLGIFTLKVLGYPVPTLAVNGALPAGVTFDAATGLLGGPPTAGTGGNYSLTFTAHNGIGENASQHFVLTIGAPLSFASANQATFGLAKPNSFTVEARGFPKAALFERGALPAGVTFDTKTGILSGAPSVGTDGTYPITFTAQNGLSAELTQNFVLLVQATANQHYVTAIYKDLLGHGPDPEGLAYWSGQLDRGDSRVTIINLFDHSTWYFGPIIESVYQKYLGRTPDAGGLAFWIQRMFDGLTDEQLEANLIASPEYFQRAGGANRSWVDAMYQDLLGRQPDSAGEAFWVGQLQLGMSRHSVALGFAASRERESQHLMAEYRKLLNRPAGNQEIDYWLSHFEQGMSNEDILTGLITSDEYFNKRP